LKIPFNFEAFTSSLCQNCFVFVKMKVPTLLYMRTFMNPGVRGYGRGFFSEPTFLIYLFFKTVPCTFAKFKLFCYYITFPLRLWALIRRENSTQKTLLVTLKLKSVVSIDESSYMLSVKLVGPGDRKVPLSCVLLRTYSVVTLVI
jgi:hypothetical protein